MLDKKQMILEALRKWINQRPGLEFGNYGDWASYRSELRQITKDRADALQLMRAVELRDSITTDDLIKAFPRAYSGRLELSEENPAINSAQGKCPACGARPGAEHKADCTGGQHKLVGPRVRLDYCTGQYWPTEYRKAAVAVLASVLWDYVRTDVQAQRVGAPDGKNQSLGDAIRAYFRREFGRGIQSRWFN